MASSSSSSSLSDALLAEFSSKLDSSLILAIAAEIDPAAPSSEQSARETLSALAQAASEQGDAHEYEQEDYAYADGGGSSPPPATAPGGSRQLLTPAGAAGASGGEASSARSSGIESEDGTAPASMASSVVSLATTASTTGTGTTDTEAASYATDDEAVERAFREWTLAEEEDKQEEASSATAPAEAGASSPEPGHSSDDVGRPSQLRRTSSRPPPRVGGSTAQTAITDDPITFLKNLFPKRERIEIQLALEDAGDDVERAIETLLTEDFLIREELEYETLIQEEENRAEREKREKQARKAKKAGKQTVSLTSTPRALHSHQKTHGNGSSKPTQEAPTSDLSSEPERPNVWARTDSTILYLSTLLSIPSGALSSLFYSNNNSLPLALSKIMDTAEPLYSSIADGPQKLAELRDLFPEKSENTLLRCLCATGGDDLGRAVELVKALEDLYAREGTPLAHGLLLNARISDPRSSKSALAQPLPRAPVPVPGSAVNGLVAGGQRAGERPPSVSDCVLLATTLRAKRDDAYRSAARTWRSKHALGNSGVAAYWAEHGRELDRQAREWELRAARATVEDRRRVARSVHSVDLHGLTVQQALTVTQECLTAWWTGPATSPTLTIVTGAGKHSAGQNPVILPAVKKLLERERYDYRFDGERVHRGSLTVTGLQGRRKVSAGW